MFSWSQEGNISATTKYLLSRHIFDQKRDTFLTRPLPQLTEYWAQLFKDPFKHHVPKAFPPTANFSTQYTNFRDIPKSCHHPRHSPPPRPHPADPAWINFSLCIQPLTETFPTSASFKPSQTEGISEFPCHDQWKHSVHERKALPREQAKSNNLQQLHQPEVQSVVQETYGKHPLQFFRGIPAAVHLVLLIYACMGFTGCGSTSSAGGPCTNSSTLQK